MSWRTISIFSGAATWRGCLRSRWKRAYDRLAALRPSPVVALNRAVAVGFSRAPAAGLAEIDAIASLGRLDDYLFLAATRADLLRRAGRPGEALPHYRRARELARNEPERRFFDRRLAECDEGARHV
jgi:RNA polymerase sigma-70 factor, ECF subfamily